MIDTNTPISKVTYNSQDIPLASNGNMKEFYKTYIESGGKFGCSNFAELDLSNITIIAPDCSRLFNQCSMLQNLNIDGLNTSNTNSMWAMFAEDSSLNNFNLSNLDTSNVTSMDSMFFGCTSITELDLSSWNTSKVLYMNNMFGGCSQLRNIIFGNNFDTSNVTNMGSMFQACNSLTSLDLSGWDTSNVTNMMYMFAWNYLLTSLNVSGFKTSKVMQMDNMFNTLSNIINLDISSFDYSGIQWGEINWLVANCGYLTSLKLGAYIPPIASNILEGCTHYGYGAEDGEILVPKGMLSLYQTATNWSNFAQYMKEYDLPQTTYKFVTTGGSSVSDIITDSTLLDSPVTTPDDTTLEFRGWYLDSEFKHKVIFPYCSQTGGEVTMYAKYSLPSPTTKEKAIIIEQSDLGVTTYSETIEQSNEITNMGWPACWFKLTTADEYANYRITDLETLMWAIEVEVQDELGNTIHNIQQVTGNVMPFNLGPNQTYYIAIAGWDGIIGDFSFKLIKE